MNTTVNKKQQKKLNNNKIRGQKDEWMKAVLI